MDVKRGRATSPQTGSSPASGAVDENLLANTRYTILVTQAVGKFIEAFTVVCSTTFKSRISTAVHPDTIRTALNSVDLDNVLGRGGALRVFRACYGFRTFLSAPEEGVRGLLRASLQLYEGPLQNLVREMKGISIQAAAASTAMKGAGKKEKEDTIQQLLLAQAEDLITSWGEQTWEQLSRNLHAEAEFPAPERFLKLKSRLQQLLAAAAADQAARQNEAYKKMLIHNLEKLNVKQQLKQLPLISSQVVTQEEEKDQEQEEEPVPAWNEFYMGWLEKKSRRGTWQRRWFAISCSQRRCWYFGAPEEQPPRATANLIGARIVQAEDERNSGEDEHTTFRIVLSDDELSSEAYQPAHQEEKKKEDEPDAIKFMTGLHTKTLAQSITLRALSASSRRHWCDMFSKAIAGVPQPQPQPPQNLLLPVIPFSSDEDSATDSPVGRKISTRVFQNEEVGPPMRKQSSTNDGSSSSSGSSSLASSPRNNKKKKKRHSSSSSSSSDSSSDRSKEEEEDDEENEEERKRREQQLYDEIAAQTVRQPTEEELKVLECVIVAVREYMDHALAYLTEQASKLLADGMLPMGRSEELHAVLLRVLIPAGQNSGNVTDTKYFKADK